jgi:hypothetical protein
MPLKSIRERDKQSVDNPFRRSNPNEIYAAAQKIPKTSCFISSHKVFISVMKRLRSSNSA